MRLSDERIARLIDDAVRGGMNRHCVVAPSDWPAVRRELERQGIGYLAVRTTDGRGATADVRLYCAVAPGGQQARTLTEGELRRQLALWLRLRDECEVAVGGSQADRRRTG